jgi:hypothetical protein
MVVNRPVAGVRNPVPSTSISSFLRAKDGGAFAAQPIGVNHISLLVWVWVWVWVWVCGLPEERRVSPVRLLEAATLFLNEKKY